MERALFVVQRLTAVLLAALVLVHLATILYASNGGLSAGEILDRTRGSLGWAVFYAVFMIAAALHAPIGIRNVLNEWTPLSRRAADVIAVAFLLLLLAAGARAIHAVYAA
jgi:fumarate reductase subunit C